MYARALRGASIWYTRADTDQIRLIIRRVSSLERAETMTVTVLLLLGKYLLIKNKNNYKNG